MFSDRERHAIARFGEIWSRVANAVPEPLPDLSDVQRTAAWLQLRDAAQHAFGVFGLRGRLSEEIEIADIT